MKTTLGALRAGVTPLTASVARARDVPERWASHVGPDCLSDAAAPIAVPSSTHHHHHTPLLPLMAYFAVTMPRSSNRSLGTAAATLRLLPLLLLLLLAAAPTGAGARPVGRAGTGGGGLGPLAAEDCAKAVPNCSQCRATKAATLCTACDFGYLVKSSGKGCCEQKKLLRYMVFGAAGGGGGGGAPSPFMVPPLALSPHCCWCQRGASSPAPPCPPSRLLFAPLTLKRFHRRNQKTTATACHFQGARRASTSQRPTRAAAAASASTAPAPRRPRRAAARASAAGAIATRRRRRRRATRSAVSSGGGGGGAARLAPSFTA